MARAVGASSFLLKNINKNFLNNFIKSEIVCSYRWNQVRFQSTLLQEKPININFRSVSPFDPVEIFKNPNVLREPEPITIPNFMNNVVESYGDKTAFMSKDLNNHKNWIPITYKEVTEQFEKLSKIFIKLGLQQHESVAILSRNCVEWVIAEMAAIYAGGQALGLYTSSSPKYCQFILNKSQAKFLVIDEDFQLEKIKKIRENLPYLQHIIQLYPKTDSGEDVRRYSTWSEVMAVNVDEQIEAEYQTRLNKIQPNECCNIVFTSGTTGDPKGAMLSHDNLIFYMTQIVKETDVFKIPNHKIISNLPFCHVAGQMEILINMYSGNTMYFDNQEPLKGSLINLVKEIRPTVFLTIPRVYEKVAEKLRTVEGKIPKWLIMKLIGLGRSKYFGVGAGGLSPEILRYLESFGMKIHRLYGLTETSGMVCVSNDENFELFDSVGKNLPSINVKISNPDADGVGEILIRGRNVFMGYIDNIDKTIEAIDDDRWLHTGDLGRMDDEGNVFVTGRIKELLVTSGAIKVPFLKIEELVKFECPAISNAFLIGNERKYLTILLTIKTEIGSDGKQTDNLTSDAIQWFKSIGIKSTNLKEILDNETTTKAIQTVIDKVNEKAEINAYKIQNFSILPVDFSILTEEFTPTLKLKREFVEKKYAEEIDKMYR